MNEITPEIQKAFDTILRFNELNVSRAPISDFLPIIDSENLIIQMRDSDIIFNGVAGLADHQMGKIIFFDQELDCELIKHKVNNQQLTIFTKGVWYARTWQPPAPYSQVLMADLKHRWELKKTKNDGFVIVTHTCEYFKYRDAHGPQDMSKDFHLDLK